MSDDDVKAIAAALETPDADLLRIRIGWHGETWLRALLADRERLQAVVDAARALADNGALQYLVDHPMDWAQDADDLANVERLQQALAALDAGQEAG